MKMYHAWQTTSSMQTLNKKQLLNIKHILLCSSLQLQNNILFIIINCSNRSWIFKQNPIFQCFYFMKNVTNSNTFLVMLINIMLRWKFSFFNCAILVCKHLNIEATTYCSINLHNTICLLHSQIKILLSLISTLVSTYPVYFIQYFEKILIIQEMMLISKITFFPIVLCLISYNRFEMIFW